MAVVAFFVMNPEPGNVGYVGASHQSCPMPSLETILGSAHWPRCARCHAGASSLCCQNRRANRVSMHCRASRGASKRCTSVRVDVQDKRCNGRLLNLADSRPPSSRACPKGLWVRGDGQHSTKTCTKRFFLTAEAAKWTTAQRAIPGDTSAID